MILKGKGCFGEGNRIILTKRRKRKRVRGEGYQKWEGGNPKMEGKTQKWEGENQKWEGGKVSKWGKGLKGTKMGRGNARRLYHQEKDGEG